jgi:hypothetical protein
MSSNDGADGPTPDDRGWGGSDDTQDDREWNDPPGVDVYGDEPAGNEADRDGSKGALNVATEGESFARGGDEREPITPGDVSLEGALFVALGVAATLFTVAQFAI